MKSSNRTNKRLTLKKKQKILKKVKEHKAQIAKVQKLQKNTTKNSVGFAIPNSAPFKSELLEKLDEQKDLVASKKIISKIDDKEGALERQKLTDLLEYNDARQNKFVHDKKEYTVTGTGLDATKTSTVQHYFGHIKEIVGQSDIVIQLLDARNPQATRCQEFEQMVKSNENKKLVFVVNKADLIPKNALIEWVAYLKTQADTVVFQCAKQKPFDPKKVSKTKNKFQLNKSKNLQTDPSVQACYQNLLNLLDLLCVKPDHDYKICITGLPHTGKKSFLNTLKLMSPKVYSQNVSAKFQLINLAANIKLLDTFGLIFIDEESKINSLARNSLKTHNPEHQVECCRIIADLCGLDVLRRHYSLQDFADYDQFLVMLTVKKGNSSSNLKPAMEQVLKDWCHGRIKYFTPLPDEMKCEANENSFTASERTAIKFVQSNVNQNLATKLKIVEPVETMYHIAA